MTRSLVSIFAAALLAACGSSDDAVPKPDAGLSVTDLAAGTYAVSAGDAASPSAGKYYAAPDGSRLLVLNDSAQQATSVYRRDAGGAWQGTPTGGTTLDLLHSKAVGSTMVTLAAVSGSYTIRLASGVVAAFSVGADGRIQAGISACKLSGELAQTTLPDTLRLALTTAGCGDLPARADGYLIVDGDYAPAAFRLVTTSSTPVDLWAYAE
jgi:hypothetical protein